MTMHIILLLLVLLLLLAALFVPCGPPSGACVPFC
jgi:hypothetical protein